MRAITTMRCLFFLALVFVFQALYSQDFEKQNKKIVILGSSVASGWVTSHVEKYDFRNGYAHRLERYLAGKGFIVINKSVPGNNTADALARFEKDVLPEDPDIVLIGLSMANEGLETEDPDSVSLSFQNGMKMIIQKCEENDIKPVLGLCYANNNYTPAQYIYLKTMNLKMDSWGYPCINFLGALDDGNGHFPEGTAYDPNHPNNRGHEEFYLSICPGLFEALESGVQIPEKAWDSASTTLGREGKYGRLFYFPSSVIHSFSFGFDFKSSGEGLLAEIISDDSHQQISLNINDGIVYTGKSGKITSHVLQNNQWQQLMIVHRYADSATLIFLNGTLLSTLKEQIEPAAFVFGGEHTTFEYRNLKIYRSALNHDEIKAGDTVLIHASLECYVPLTDRDFGNLAQNNTELVADPENPADFLNLSIKKIQDADKARRNELVAEPRKAIALDPEKYRQFEGKYKISEDDFFEVLVEHEKIFFIDRGQKAEILPESETVFFYPYPGDITFTFDKDSNGNVITLTANLNGYILVGYRNDQ